MIKFILMKKNGYALVLFCYIVLLSLLNLFIGLKYLHDPSPLPSSYWDLRWVVVFAGAFLSVGVLFFFSSNRLLITLGLIGLAASVILPIVTIGAGAACLMLLLILLISLGAGEFILKALLGVKLRDGLERSTLAILLGLGLIMILVSLQGGLQAFNPVVTWSGLGVLSAIFVIPRLKHWFFFIRDSIARLRQFFKQGDLSGWAVGIAILVILWIPSWLIALAPAIRYDELTYHLAGPMFYIREGGIAPFPEGGMNTWLHYAEMLYTFALQTAGQPLPRIIHLLMGTLSAILVFLLGCRLANKRVGMVAAILFLAVPAISYEMATAYIDLFVTTFSLSFGFALVAWWLERNPRWLLVAGALGGIGLGIKLTAGPVLCGLLVMLLLGALARQPRHKNLLWVGALIGLIVMVALPWLVRDTLWTGDPIYPYGTKFIQKVSTPVTDASTGGSLNIIQVAAKSIRYPFDLVLNSRNYYHEGTGGMASALPLLAVPIYLFTSRINRQSKILVVTLLIASEVAVGMMFATNTALIRYALPIFPYLAVSAAMNLETIYGWLTERKSNLGLAVLFVTLLVYLFSTRMPLILRNYDILPQRFPINYILGRESREEFLSKNLAVYDAFRYIDSQPGAPHRVLSIGNEYRLYTKSRIDGVNDVPEAYHLLSSARLPAELAYSLEQAGYDYLLINQPGMEIWPSIYADPFPILENSDFINLYCELVFLNKGVYVYRFNVEGVHLPGINNLLGNSGFEEVVGINEFPDWEEQGRIEVSNTSQLGGISLLLHGPSSIAGSGYVAQKVAVEGGEYYTLAYYVKSDLKAIFLMQIRWFDQEGNLIRRDEDWRNTTSDWQWYSITLQSPDDARYAEVYISLGGAESALIDEVCLSAGQRCTSP